MDGKIHALMLRKTPYSDKGSIVELFSREHGKVAFMHYQQRGKSAKGGYLPLLAELEISCKPGRKRGLPLLSEYRISEPLINCSLHVEKTAVLFFIAELLQRCIQEEQPEQALYSFTVSCLEELESDSLPTPMVPLLYCSKLCDLLGFSIATASEVPANAYFSIREGCFVPKPALYEPSFFLEPNDALHFYNAHRKGNFPTLHKERQALLKNTLTFLNYHVPELGGMKSHEVLKSIFQAD